jgi:hypothetical protein
MNKALEVIPHGPSILHTLATRPPSPFHQVRNLHTYYASSRMQEHGEPPEA